MNKLVKISLYLGHPHCENIFSSSIDFRGNAKSKKTDDKGKNNEKQSQIVQNKKQLKYKLKNKIP